MTYKEFIEGLRLVDALFSAVIVGILMYRTRRWWSFYDKQQKLLVISYASYIIAIAYTSFELYSHNDSVGYRSYFVFAANVLTAYAFTMNKKPGLMDMTIYEKRLEYGMPDEYNDKNDGV